VYEKKKEFVGERNINKKNCLLQETYNILKSLKRENVCRKI